MPLGLAQAAPALAATFCDGSEKAKSTVNQSQRASCATAAMVEVKMAQWNLRRSW
jgi:hypothetical protein